MFQFANKILTPGLMPAEQVFVFADKATTLILLGIKINLVKITSQSNFQLSVERNPGLHWSCFTVLCEWFRKLAPPSKPIRYKTKTNRDLVTRVFPRLRPVTCVYFDFSLAPSDIFVCSNWPLRLLWFWFYDTQAKSALTNDFEVCICCGQQKATAILICRLLLRFPGTFGCGCMFVFLEGIFLQIL